MMLSMLLAALLIIAMHVQSALVSSSMSIVICLGAMAYYMHHMPESDLEAASTSMALPATVFRIEDGHNLTVGYLQAELERFAASDDVWSPAFLSNVIIVHGGEAVPAHREIQDFFNGKGTSHIHYVPKHEPRTYREGPFFLHDGKLHAAYRLYPDIAGAFVVGTVPADAHFTYKAVDAAAYGEEYPTALSIPVPSRLHFTKSAAQPYAGMRIALKDIIDLAGLKTGASSRAYTQLYPPRSANAETVQRLLSLGFVVVGKVKTTQFADSEWPTCDWIDYHAPFNPVADGYQTTSGSSAGSAAAVATYEWLDFALGTDTLGSIRAPATAQGIYGMRSSLGAASFAGVIPYSPHFDTMGAFARDASSYATIARALYGSTDAVKCSKKPPKLLYPTDYWPIDDEEAQKAYDAYIVKLERYLGVERSEINLARTWQETNPVKTNKTLEEYFGHVFEWVANPDQWTGFFKTFNDEYEAAYGHQPVLNPQLRFKRDWLPSTLDPNRQAKGLELMDMFQKWFEDNIIAPKSDGCADVILVLPWSNGEPDYRDRYRESEQKFTGRGFFFYNIAPYGRCPELIVPAGHTTFKSKVTLREERLPVGLGIVSGRGSDVFLADMISDMEADSTKAEVVEAEGHYAESVFAEDRIRGDFSIHEPQGAAQQVLPD